MPVSSRHSAILGALVAVLFMAALAAWLGGRAQAGPPILSTSTMTVDTTADTVSSADDKLSLREAVMLANGDRSTAQLSAGELDNINASGVAPGAIASDSIIFDANVFPTNSTSLVPLGSPLPVLDTGLDSVRGSGNTVGAGLSNVRIVGDGSGGAGSFDCFTINSNSNSIRGVAVTNCKEAIKVSGQLNTIGGSNLVHRVTVFDNQQGVNLHGAGESIVENLVAYENTVAGITVGGASAQGNEVRASSIGISPANPAAGGNLLGVRIISSASNNIIGGSNSGASASLVEGNVISGNGTGVQINGANTQSNEVIGNFIGTNVTGTAAEPNGIGVVLENGARFNSVGERDPGEGNLISGNTTNGVDVNGASVNLIFANLIGTDSSGMAPLPNGGDGVLVRGKSQFISIGNDSDIPSRNVISGNQGAGVKFSGAGTSNNNVRLAFIGTDFTGSQPIPNTIGVQIVAGASENSVGGAPDETNVISGNIVGASISGSNSNTISANYFGTDATGTEALPNGRGIVIDGGASGNTIGGTTPGRANVISASNHNVAPHGIDLGSAHSNVIQGNKIGTDASGDNPIPNLGSGIRLLSNTSNTLVGGSDPGAANLIAYNGGAGIFVSEFDPADPSRSHTISRNSIHSNGGLGIELSQPSGPNTNDDMDPDVGANNLQNHPDLTSAGPASASPAGPVIGPGPSTPITGSLNSTPNTDFRVEFFANDECDGSGFGEGQEYVSSLAVTTDANGDADLSSNIAEVDAGRYVTATATNLTTGDTSEFSACVLVAGDATPTPTPSPTPSPSPVATPTPTPSPTPTTPPGNGLTQGDNDCDGDSDAVDALVSLQSNAGFPYNQQPDCVQLGAAVPAGGEPQLFGDIDCDDDVDAVDALQILRSVAGLPVNQNPNCPAIGDQL